MAQGIRDQALGSHILPKQRKNKARCLHGEGSVSYLDQCLSLSLGQVLSLAISLFPLFSYLRQRDRMNKCEVVLINLCFESAEKWKLVKKRPFPKHLNSDEKE